MNVDVLRHEITLREEVALLVPLASGLESLPGSARWGRLAGVDHWMEALVRWSFDQTSERGLAARLA
jgi:hypothetical protein